MQPRLLAIVGPTAVGKTDVAIECARLLTRSEHGRRAGEIISADSVQVYRGMDIGSAKASPEQRASIPHHLIDVVDPDTDFSVGLYKELAETAINDILTRGKQPILVGGSGMYVRSITGTWGMTGAPKDEAVRERLRTEAREYGLTALYARLMRVDPEAAERIPPADEKRIIRALEVCELTGLPITHYHRLDQQKTPAYNTVMVGLTLPRPVLYARIDERIDRMMAAGFLAEVERLHAAGCSPDLVSMKSLGYAHLLSYLSGAETLEAAIERFKRNTRRFAKRQMTWFRAEKDIHWIDVSDRDAVDVAAESVALFANKDSSADFAD